MLQPDDVLHGPVISLDLSLRPAMTTWNKIIFKTIPDAIYVTIECISTDADSVQYVYKKNKTKQIVILVEMNEKNVLVREGLEPRILVYDVMPENSASFRVVGKNLLNSNK